MLSLILPTYNESKNLPELLPVVRRVLADTPHEIIVVDDDSPDGTWRTAQELAAEYQDLHVIRRIGRRGLSSAVIEGFLAAKGDVFAVMDADGQHDTELLAKLYTACKETDIAIGSRYVEGGSVGNWDERRFQLSRLATALAIKLCKVKVQDPMSGFFAVKRSFFEATVNRLNPKGFKILLDLLVHAPKGTSVEELPFTFSERLHGESKLSAKVQLEFLEYLYDVTIGHFIPLDFLKYCIVGSLGVVVNVFAYALYAHLLMENATAVSIGCFSLALILAIETAVIFNFLLNNVWTFARVRLRGIQAFIGFAKYNAACALGALANVAVSVYLFKVAGFPEILSVIIGAFTAVCWNYAASKMVAWRG